VKSIASVGLQSIEIDLFSQPHDLDFPLAAIFGDRVGILK
jgi:hypothetical protein